MSQARVAILCGARAIHKTSLQSFWTIVPTVDRSTLLSWRLPRCVTVAKLPRWFYSKLPRACVMPSCIFTGRRASWPHNNVTYCTQCLWNILEDVKTSGSMVKTATNPNNTYSSSDACIIDRRLYTYMYMACMMQLLSYMKKYNIPSRAMRDVSAKQIWARDILLTNDCTAKTA